MGYIMTGVILFGSFSVLATVFELLPARIKNEINELLERIGG